MTPDDVEIIEMPDQDTPTTAEIINSSESDMAPMPEGSLTFENAASLPSPQARHQDGLCPNTQADFEHRVSSDLSSLSTDFDATHSPRDPVPPHFTPRRADMVSLSLRPCSGGSAADETVTSHPNDNSFSDHDEDERDPLKDVPASYVPCHWPTGPRNLAPGRYVCPFVGCKHPVGPTEEGDGYSRTTLGPHIRTHENYPWGGWGALDGMFGLESTMKIRVWTLREHQRRNLKGPPGVVIDLSRNNSAPLSIFDKPIQLFDDPVQKETDALIPYLEEIKNFERSTLLRDPTINDRKLRLYFRGDEMLEGPEIEKKGRRRLCPAIELEPLSQQQIPARGPILSLRDGDEHQPQR